MPNSSLEQEERHVFDQFRTDGTQNETRNEDLVNLFNEIRDGIPRFNAEAEAHAPIPSFYEAFCNNLQDVIEIIRNPYESISTAMEQTRDRLINCDPCESISSAIGHTRYRLIDLGNRVTEALIGCGFFSAEQPGSDGEQNGLLLENPRNSA